MQTSLRTRLGIELPIIQAPMGGAVGPALAAAVSNAGGLGTLVLWRANAEEMRRQIDEMRALTSSLRRQSEPGLSAGRTLGGLS